MTHSVLVEEVVRRVVARLMKGPTFGELAREWFSRVRAGLTQPSSEHRQLELLGPLWGLRESELTAPMVRSVLDGLLRQGGGMLGPAGRNHVQATGRRVIATALEDGRWYGPNPFALVQRAKEVRPPRWVPNLEQLRRVLSELSDVRRREVLFMVSLGPRPGELRALRKSDVNHELHVVAIHRSNHRDATKTGEPRFVSVPDALWPVLLEALAASPSELVFPRPDGLQQSRFAHRSGCMRRAFARAGIQGAERFRYYDLRHTAASLHVEAGCDHAVVRATLGHARNLTERVYTHLSADYCRAELGKMVGRLLSA